MTVITGYVTLVTFIKGYAHCDICEGLCCIVMFIKVYVSLWRYRGLYHITTLSHRLLQWVFNKHYVVLWCLSKCQLVIFIKGYVTLWCLSRFMFHYDIIKGYITLQCKAMVCYSGHLISVMSHCDVYERLCYISNIY